jgi:hypothetical protein
MRSASRTTRCSVAGSPFTVTAPTSVCGTPSASMAFFNVAARAQVYWNTWPRLSLMRKGSSLPEKEKLAMLTPTRRWIAASSS